MEALLQGEEVAVALGELLAQTVARGTQLIVQLQYMPFTRQPMSVQIPSTVL